MNDTIIVIGAGISGMSAAHKLTRAGKKVIVLEASGRAGGRLTRVENNGDFAEAGGQGIHSNYREMLKLIDEYGLTNDLVPQEAHGIGYLDRKGKLQTPEGMYGVLKLMNLRGKLETAWFAMRHLGWSKKFDLFKTETDIPDYDNYSAADRFSWAGKDFRDFFLRPCTDAMVNTTPEHTNWYHVLNLFKIVTTTTVATLRDGNASLCERIAESVDVRYNSPVRKIIMGTTDRAECVLLENGETIAGSHVIVTCPAGLAAKLLPEELHEEKRFLGSFPSAPFALVYFWLDRKIESDAFVLFGHGYRDATYNMAINHTVKTPHAVPSGKTLISAWSSYPAAAKFENQSDDQLTKNALKDMEAFYPGISHMVAHAKVQRHPWGIARLSPGLHAKILQFKRKSDSLPNISFAGTDYDGVHMESGVRNGIAAAERAIRLS